MTGRLSDSCAIIASFLDADSCAMRIRQFISGLVAFPAAKSFVTPRGLLGGLILRLASV